VPIRKQLREKAAKYLRLRDGIADRPTQKALEEVAAELERKADQLDKESDAKQRGGADQVTC
jgi:hypothetical protein